MSRTVNERDTIDLHFPIAGIDISDAFYRQKAREVRKGVYARTTPEALNVRGFESAERARGGSRAGLTKHLPVRPGDTEYVMQDMATIAWKDDA